MGEAFDPFWQAAAHSVAALGLAAEKVYAPAGFAPLLPGCLTASDTPDFGDLAAVIIHKGRLEDVPPDIFMGAIDHLAVTFANEVFLVFARTGPPTSPDNPHLMTRGALVAAALQASHRKHAKPAPLGRTGRMPATYVGAGRVLLETAFGHLMLVDGADTAIVPHLVRDGLFDRNLTALIGAILSPGMIFIDIGANIGTYTLIGAARVGERGRVIAIEPSPRLAGLVFENVTMNGFAARCDVLRCGAGAHNGTATLYEFATRQGSNTLLQRVADTAHAEYGEAITPCAVEIRTLDSIVANLTPERLDCIKIDVEGFEQQVLAGARDTIMRFRPRVILEWHSAFFSGREDEARALHDLLTGPLGYALHRIEAEGATRAVTLDELMKLGHSDVLAEPLA